jgi:hypothetical protein
MNISTPNYTTLSMTKYMMFNVSVAVCTYVTMLIVLFIFVLFGLRFTEVVWVFVLVAGVFPRVDLLVPVLGVLYFAFSSVFLQVVQSR